MDKKSSFQILRLLEQAQKQHTKLQMLKLRSMLQNSRQNKLKKDQRLREGAINLISFYQNILSVNSSLKFSQKDNKTCESQYGRSHSRSQLRGRQQKTIQIDINAMILSSTLSCTIAQIQTNFLGSLQQAGNILFKTKEDIALFRQKLQNQKQSNRKKSERRYEMNNFGMKAKRQNETERQQSERSSISLSKFYNKPINIMTKNTQNTSQSNHQLNLIFIRVSMNLVINLILQNKHNFAVEMCNEIVQFIKQTQNQSNRWKLIQFIFMAWFNIQSQNFTTWRNHINSFRSNQNMAIQQRLSLQKAVSLSHYIFNSDLFSHQQTQIQQKYPNHYIKILEKSIQTFMQNKNYNLAFFTLRHLLQSPVSPELKQKYYIQLRQMLESGRLQEDIQLQNIQSVQCFKSIISTLNNLVQTYQPKNLSQEESLLQSKRIVFGIVVKIQISKISSQSSLTKQQKDFLIQKLLLMKTENNLNIINSMLNQKLAKSIIQQLKQKTTKISTILTHQLSNRFNSFMSNLESFKYKKSQFLPLADLSINTSNTILQNKSQTKLKMVSPNHSRRYLKVISTSVLTDVSTIYPSSHQKHRIFQSNLSICLPDQKKISKMVRFCQHGAFLNKRNYNSDGGELKFIKITNDKIKWSKNPQKIDESTQSYPLKDIKGIIYGKVTPNLKKLCNKTLKEEFCFSLILQKRTMDFYCKDYKEVQSWVCGLSAILKKQNSQISGYTPGKMRWRKMFALLREAFIQPLKLHEKNQFCFQNAYSLISFKRNGYKLPQSQKIL